MIRNWVERAAAARGAGGYLTDARGSQTLSYADLERRTRAWERLAEQAGLPSGARVAVSLADPLDYATALIGLMASGRVAVPLDPGAPAAGLARVLEVARPQAVVAVSPAGLPPGLRLIQPPTGPGETDGVPSRSASPCSAAPTSAAGTGGIFLCTSGTTGTPKGILLREDQLAHVAGSVASHHRLTSADRGYCSLPLFHVNAEVVGLLATLRAQASLALDRRFSRAGFWEMIERQRITWINAVPAIIALLACDPPPRRPRSVRFIRSASAPLPRAVLERFEEAAGIPVIETYGMTEAASMITANPLDGPRKPGSAGRPAGTELLVTDPSGLVCQAFAVGRVRIRGRGVITEYAEGGRPEVIDAQGWVDTGDLGYLDDDGYLFLAGRSDDVINRGGEKIYPREIEEVLLAQHGVRSAAVVGARDDVLGERPVAYVVPDDDAGPCLTEALRAACQEQLPRYKQPSSFHLVAEMPLGPTGKVVRRRLADLAATRR